MAEPKEEEFLDDVANAEAEEFLQNLDELEDEAIELDELKAATESEITRNLLNFEKLGNHQTVATDDVIAVLKRALYLESGSEEARDSVLQASKLLAQILGNIVFRQGGLTQEFISNTIKGIFSETEQNEANTFDLRLRAVILSELLRVDPGANLVTKEALNQVINGLSQALDSITNQEAQEGFDRQGKTELAAALVDLVLNLDLVGADEAVTYSLLNPLQGLYAEIYGGLQGKKGLGSLGGEKELFELAGVVAGAYQLGLETAETSGLRNTIAEKIREFVEAHDSILSTDQTREVN